MGWDYHHETPPYDRRSIIRRHLSKEFEAIKDTVVGTTYYGAIREKATGHVHALVVLTDVDKKKLVQLRRQLPTTKIAGL